MPRIPEPSQEQISEIVSGPRCRWIRLSSNTGALPLPTGGAQQTACVTFDIDGDGRADIVIGERTGSSALVWLRPTDSGWERYVIDPGPRRIEAGGVAYDVDGDGHPDLIIGGDARSNELWWYENPAPDFDPERPWTRRLIKAGGARAHHDQAVADFLGIGRPQLAFWNQGTAKLFLAPIPEDPCGAPAWPCFEIFDYSSLTGPIKQEGLCACDLDGDGRPELIGGQFLFRHQGGYRFQAIQIADRPGRVVAGRFTPASIPQLVFAPGDGDGPLRFYECTGTVWDENAWVGRDLLPFVRSGHTLELGDLDGDGNLDLYCAEMHTPGPGDACRAWILYGNGRGDFEVQTLSVGLGNHDSRLADVNGDGRLDIVVKPYTWDAPRLDVWLNAGPPA